jgi:hypothetical protein
MGNALSLHPSVLDKPETLISEKRSSSKQVQLAASKRFTAHYERRFAGALGA